MKLALDLPTDVSIGLRRLANELGEPVDLAAIRALRDALIALGHIEVVEMDEKPESEGGA